MNCYNYACFVTDLQSLMTGPGDLVIFGEQDTYYSNVEECDLENVTWEWWTP